MKNVLQRAFIHFDEDKKLWVVEFIYTPRGIIIKTFFTLEEAAEFLLKNQEI